jgi:hypothetical protein
MKLIRSLASILGSTMAAPATLGDKILAARGDLPSIAPINVMPSVGYTISRPYHRLRFAPNTKTKKVERLRMMEKHRSAAAERNADLDRFCISALEAKAAKVRAGHSSHCFIHPNTPSQIALRQRQRQMQAA